MNDKDLIDKYDQLCREVMITKYHHIKSVGNFIAYLDAFGSMQYKSKAIDLLIGYFDFVLVKESITREDGKYLYYTFIKPLGKIYSWNFKFIIYLDIFTLLIFIGIWFLVAFLIKASIFTYLASFIVGIVIYLPFYFKKKENKVYAFGY